MKTKKTWNKALSVFMAVVMLVGAVVFTLPVSAADTNKMAYTAKGVDPALMVVDGTVSANEPWEDADWRYFKTDYKRNSANEADRFKVLWGGEYVYFLIEFVDSNGVYDNPNSNYTGDGFLLYVDESGIASCDNGDSDDSELTWRTGTCYTQDTGNVAKNTNNNSTVEYLVDRRNLDGTNNADGTGQLVRIEARMTLKTYKNSSNRTFTYATAGNTIGFDIRIQPNNGTSATFINIGETNKPQSYVPCTLGDIEYAANSIKRADGMITVDGNAGDEAWTLAPTQVLKKYAGATYNGKQHTLKTLWGVENGVPYVYMLLTINNPGVSTSDKAEFIVSVDETGTSHGNLDGRSGEGIKVYRTGNTSLDMSKTTVTGTNGNVAYAASIGAVSNNTRTTVIEMKAKLTSLTAETAVNEIIGMNVKASTIANTHEATLNGGDWGNNIGNFSKFKLSNEKINIERQVTLMNGHTNTVVQTVKANKGGQYVLPTVDLGDGKPFLGWIVGEQLLPAGASITISDNTTIYGLSIGLSMEDGAAVRLTQTTGMRWITYLDDANLPLAAQIVSKGTLIVPEDYLHKKANGESAEIEFTHAGLEAAGRVANQANGYLDLVATEFVPEAYLYKNANGRKQFNGSIVEIREGNYERDFVAVGYVKVKYSNGQEAYIYADHSECVRNVKEIALDALEDTTMTYSASELAVLNKFAGKQ